MTEPGEREEIMDEEREAWVEERIRAVINRIRTQPVEKSLDEFERLARMLIIECGDADAIEWPANLHLSDVLEKHLVRRLYGWARPKL